MRHHRLHDDEGVTLALTLLVMLMFALTLSYTLSYAFTSMRESSSLKVQRDTLYATDGAVKVAVQQALDSFVAAAQAGTDSTWGNGCPHVATQSVNGVQVSVTCEGTSWTLNGDDQPRPDYAVTALGPGGVTVNGGGTVTIGASNNKYVYSRGPIAVRDKKSTLVAAGASGTSGLLSADKKACNDHSKGHIDPGCTSTTTVPTDPKYAPLALAADVNDAVFPGTTCTGTVNGTVTLVTFEPGRYASSDDFKALDKACKDKDKAPKNAVGNTTIWWFKPGPYYFDFGKHGELKIDDPHLYVIGGAPRGWNEDSPTVPDVPGGCDRMQDGVQWVFGGATRLSMNAGYLDLCPPRGKDYQNSSGMQSIAIYGPASTAYGYATQRGPLLKLNDHATVSIEGTLYAPNADLDLKTKKITTPVVQRGIIAHSVKLSAGKYTGPTVLLPPPISQARHDVTVTFTACLPASDGSCGEHARVDSTVVLTYQATATPQGRAVSTSWHYTR